MKDFTETVDCGRQTDACVATGERELSLLLLLRGRNHYATDLGKGSAVVGLEDFESLKHVPEKEQTKNEIRKQKYVKLIWGVLVSC